MKKALKILALLVVLLLAGLVIFGISLNEKEPQGQAGPEAEQMAAAIFSALDKAAWDTTAVVQWTSMRKIRFVWQKMEGRCRVDWDDVSVDLRLADQTGTATKNGAALSGDDLQKSLEKAWKQFCNDSFWLIAPFKIADEGTTREAVTLPDGRKGLKITYASGGATPGDRYVWILGENGAPTALKIWAKILPIGGLEWAWENWKTLPTGAKIATDRRLVRGGFLMTNTGLSGH